MKCPLTFKTARAFPRGIVANAAECLRDKCAWWDDANRSCVALTIGQELRIIENALSFNRPADRK